MHAASMTNEWVTKLATLTEVLSNLPPVHDSDAILNQYIDKLLEHWRHIYRNKQRRSSAADQDGDTKPSLLPSSIYQIVSSQDG